MNAEEKIVAVDIDSLVEELEEEVEMAGAGANVAGPPCAATAIIIHFFF